MKSAVIAALVLACACGDDAGPRETAPVVDVTLACEAHADCRVLSGVCGSPTPVNEASVRAVERQIEVRGRHRSCDRPGIRVDETTPACVRGACTALLGRPAERGCARDADCVIAEGLCGPSEAIRADARDTFASRLDELRARRVRCGYGRPLPAVRAECDQGLCVAASAR